MRTPPTGVPAPRHRAATPTRPTAPTPPRRGGFFRLRSEKLLARLIEAGQKKGRFRSSRSAADLARMLVVVQQGVSTLARAGASSRDLERAVDEALAHVIIG